MKGETLCWDYWSDELAIGIEAIDHDHREILDLIGHLREAFDQPEGDAAVRIALHRINRYADRHFQREEDMLQQVAYPYLAQHRQRHDAFRAYVAAVADGPQAVPEVGELLSWLVDWWVGHIGSEDKLYRPYVEKGQ